MSQIPQIPFSHCQSRDIRHLLRLKNAVWKNKSWSEDTREKKLEELVQSIERSKSLVQARLEQRPKISFPPSLPVSQQSENIIKHLKSNQVLILAGETGSGKTTQLPKLCLEAGFGARGLIGHTQPRRVAATSVAARIAEELNSELGEYVGVAVRFFEKFEPTAYVKVMTDGILLTEIQRDPLLNQYEVIIIDEAHERSINIDFLLGYLKTILPKRPDLKVVITSATIDVERFSQHFDNAPILSVQGRTYPVEIRYCEHYFEQNSQGLDPTIFAIDCAVNDALKEGRGDILIFLSGEGEIRQVAKHLRQKNLNQTHILPMYARLSIAEQQRVFRPVQGRKIVLSTNVAETSITVPGIRFVIDPGLARISRFSMRSKIQRLPIEKVSQASANQRAGRCGRVSSGICFRLYGEDDFISRTPFTLPEIKRTNLASVILQLKTMKIDHVESFPFIDSPEEKHWKDGLNALFELGAIDKAFRLTTLGRTIARMPIDPKLAVMLVSSDNKALKEALIIASFFSIRDPRERPAESRQKADQIHSQWQDKKSDFVSIIMLWRVLHEKQEELSSRLFKEFCEKHFIHFVAWLEWRNTYRQLKQVVLDNQLQLNQQEADYDTLHQSLLPALLSNVLNRSNENYYFGARNTRVWVHPSSTNFKNKTAWLMAAELVETEKLYARMTAPIMPEWIEAVAEHLCKVSYQDIHWRKTKGEACAFMQKSLYGLLYVVQRMVGYSDIEPNLSRQWLIEKGLLDGEIKLSAPFHSHNQTLLNEFKEQEIKQRKATLLKPEEEIAQWFDDRLPSQIVHVRSLIRWLKKKWPERNQQLKLTEQNILNPTSELDEHAFPPTICIRDCELSLEYRFEPGHEDDGVSIVIALTMLNQFQDRDFDWMVPGLLEEKILRSIKALPKALRKNFIPAPEYAKACFERLRDRFGEGDFFEALIQTLNSMSGITLPFDSFRDIELDEHLQMNIKVFDSSKKPIAKGRNLQKLQQSLQGNVKAALNAPVASNVTSSSAKSERTQFSIWPDEFKFSSVESFKEHKQQTRQLKALKDLGNDVELVKCESVYQAELTHRKGICRLLLNLESKTVKYFLRSWQHQKELKKLCTLIGTYDEVVHDMALAIAKKSMGEATVETKDQFDHVHRIFEKDLTKTMNEGLTLLLSLLQKNKTISHVVFESVEPKYLQSYLDIREQLDCLWKPNFIFDFGFEKLNDYDRYLSSLLDRIDRMEINFPREQRCLREFQRVKQWFENLPENLHNRSFTEAKMDLSWILMEYRVSLFSPNVKTAFTVSEKRIEKQLDSIKKLI